MRSPEKEQWEQLNRELSHNRVPQNGRNRNGSNLNGSSLNSNSPSGNNLNGSSLNGSSLNSNSRNWTFGIFIAMVIAAVVMIVLILNGVFNQSGNVPQDVKVVTYQNNILVENEEFISSLSKLMEESSKQTDGAAFKKTIFLGDSLTEGIGLYGYAKVDKVFAKRGMSIELAMKKVNKMSKEKPKYIFVMLGINDLNYAGYSIDDIESNYNKLVKKIHKKMPEAQIYVQSLLPVTAKYEKSNKRITNTRINKLNKRLKTVAGKYDYATYVNVNKLYKNKKGVLPSKLSSDGYHLISDAYSTWIDCVKSEIKN